MKLREIAQGYRDQTNEGITAFITKIWNKIYKQAKNNAEKGLFSLETNLVFDQPEEEWWLEELQYQLLNKSIVDDINIKMQFSSLFCIRVELSW